MSYMYYICIISVKARYPEIKKKQIWNSCLSDTEVPSVNESDQFDNKTKSVNTPETDFSETVAHCGYDLNIRQVREQLFIIQPDKTTEIRSRQILV